jgi:CHAD domain-containing protein
MRRNTKRGPEPGTAPPTIQDATLRRHAKCLRRYDKALRRCRRNLSGGSVHELRVATRRLLAQLELLKPFIPAQTFRKVRRRLKRQLNASALLRDAQVQLLKVGGMLPEHLDLAPVHGHLEKKEQCLKRLAKRKFKGSGKLLRRLKAIEGGAASGLCARNGILRYRATVRLAIRRACLRLEEFRRRPPRDSAGIHRLRVVLKKFRYLVESLPMELSVLRPEEIRLIRTHLDLMGEIHDLDLLIGRLQGIAAKKMRGRTGFDPLLKTLRRQYSAQVVGWRRRTAELFSSLDVISRADPLYPRKAGGAGGRPAFRPMASLIRDYAHDAPFPQSYRSR